MGGYAGAVPSAKRAQTGARGNGPVSKSIRFVPHCTKSTLPSSDGRFTKRSCQQQIPTKPAPLDIVNLDRIFQTQHSVAPNRFARIPPAKNLRCVKKRD